MLKALCLLMAGIGITTGGSAFAMDARARLNQAVAIEKPDQALFAAAVLFYSNEVRRQHGRAALRPDPGLTRAAADHARNMARLRTHSHVLPVRGQAGPVAADAPPVARVPQGRGEHRHGQGLSPARPADCHGAPGVQLHLRRHPGSRFRSTPTRAWRRRWWRAGWRRRSTGLRCCRRPSERLGAGIGVDPRGAACGDFYLVQNFAD